MGGAETIPFWCSPSPSEFFPFLAFWQLAEGLENYTHDSNPVRVAPASVRGKRSEQWPVRAGKESPKGLPRHLIPPTMEQWCICHWWAAIEWARLTTERRHDQNDEEALAWALWVFVAVRIHRMEGETQRAMQDGRGAKPLCTPHFSSASYTLNRIFTMSPSLTM